MRKIIVKKLLEMRKIIKAVDEVVLLSFLFGAAGIGIYLYFYPSKLILLESLVWFLEGVAFLGMLVLLHLITSKTLYSSRFQILRTENLVTVIFMILTIAVIAKLLISSLEPPDKPSPLWLSLYLFSGSLLSLFLAFWISRAEKSLKTKLLVASTAAKKLKMDSVIELFAGLSIVLSNLFSKPLLENLMIFVVSVYVIQESLKILFEAFLSHRNRQNRFRHKGKNKKDCGGNKQISR